MEEGKYCTALFLDIEKAFDNVWHKRLLEKLRIGLSADLYPVISSYLTSRYFYVKIRNATSSRRKIEAGVPQESILGPILYSIFTADLPTVLNTETYTFADDTAILSVKKNVKTATSTLQNHLQKMEDWMRNNKIKINITKCSHITFTLKKEEPPKIKLQNLEVPQTNSVKYLGLHLDKKLNWKKHIQEKIKHINISKRSMYWLMAKNSKLSAANKLLLYKVILKPIWTYGLQIWGMAAKSNIKKMESTQSKILRSVLQAPWYVRNDDIRKTPKIPTVEEEIVRHSKAHQNRTSNHVNPLASDCYSNLPRRLKRKHPIDLLNNF
ncbi:hypothetical protein KPH14_012564 [Odynerus spinipes]|uniref:Reverse transcriptase domain-containing protein n=1 Tax=Odynerus spinipes TaxID=1348599 RepID=A0AAD9RG71_9HYME|nr:hypothetical protein KPH14_012564 [Odynerus spinipes]